MLFKSLLIGQVCFDSSILFITFSPPSPSMLCFQTHGSYTISPLESIPALRCSYSYPPAPSPKNWPPFPSPCLNLGCPFCRGAFLILLLFTFPEFQNRIQPCERQHKYPFLCKDFAQIPQSELIISASQDPPSPEDFRWSTCCKVFHSCSWYMVPP